ncbi:MAG: hypothetical protein KGO05_00955 [Chloroflexota bacterium]|nr:hypothetical protein [Chloroflexota bacterium]
MGLLRNLAATIFGFLLLTALWVTALTSLSMRPSATAIITDLGVDALNPWLVTKGFGVSAAGYVTLEKAATASPGASLALNFIKPVVKGSEIKGLSYDQGMRVIYGHVAGAYYDGGPQAAFSLPAPIASVVQNFALFPEQYNTVVKSTGLPSCLQPFMLFTGLSPETFTAVGHASFEALLPKFWLAALVIGGALFGLSFLSRKNPLVTVGGAAWHGSWPTLAVFAVLWGVGKLYPANFHAVAGAFGVVAQSFAPTYAIAAAVGAGLFLLGKFGGSFTKLFARSGARAKPSADTMGGYATRADRTPNYTPGSYNAGAGYDDRAPRPQQWGAPQQPQQPQWGAPQQPQQGAPEPLPWERGAPAWSNAPTAEPNPGAWNQPRPWDAPDPNTQGQGGSWREYPPVGPDDPTTPQRR